MCIWVNWWPYEQSRYLSSQSILIQQLLDCPNPVVHHIWGSHHLAALCNTKGDVEERKLVSLSSAQEGANFLDYGCDAMVLQ